ncbi:nucleotide disphospho-sugar-binding domain-containing protein [Nonomuraea sp. NPDC049709]|uniref:glycosyltransferase n=1 Tax=Nonomuraea sp. NPDC049709 TaxID=3154736 RepID=UPI003439CD7E
MTHGSDGDVLPFVRLGRVLRERGHEVTILTHSPYRGRVEEAGLGFVPIDTPEGFERYSADTALLPGGKATLDWLGFYRRNALFDQLATECRALAARVRPGRTVLVGRHTSALSVLLVRELLGVPAAWVAVAPIQPMATDVARHLHQHVLAGGIDEVRARLGLGPVGDWRAWFSSADLQLGLWPRWFDEAGPGSGTAIVLTGFPIPDDPPNPPPTTRSQPVPERRPAPAPGDTCSGPERTDRDGEPEISDRCSGCGREPVEGLPAEVVEFLGGPVPPVLVTGGTGRMLHEGFYRAAMGGCRIAGLPMLLVVPHAELVPRPLPPDVRWSPRLPFRTVMPQVAAVLHHGGIGTLTRALVAGTPQVILAHGADRPDNAARLAAAGLARWLPEHRWTAEDVAEALTAALKDGRARPGIVPQDAAGSLVVAAEHLESLLKPSATRPPTNNRPTLTPQARSAQSPPARAPSGQSLPAQAAPVQPPPVQPMRVQALPVEQRRVLAARLRRRRAERGAP